MPWSLERNLTFRYLLKFNEIKIENKRISNLLRVQIRLFICKGESKSLRINDEGRVKNDHDTFRISIGEGGLAPFII
jgi:hypothetical protein